jgi:hypothetical protein
VLSLSKDLRIRPSALPIVHWTWISKRHRNISDIYLAIVLSSSYIPSRYIRNASFVIPKRSAGSSFLMGQYRRLYSGNAPYSPSWLTY